MAGYTRQSVADIIAGEVINAAPINAEYNQLRDAFAFATGHTHNGSSVEGAYIPLIADVDALNKVVVDTTNNRISFYSQVGAGTIEQLRIQDGAIVPVTDEDIDLGAVGAEFKDLYIDGIGYIDTIHVHENAVITGTLGVTGHTTVTTLTASGTITGALTGNVTGNTAGVHTGAVTGNITGNITGDVTGDVTGNLTGNVTSTGTSTLASVDINGGTIDATIIGATTPAAATVTSLVATTADINGGTIDGTQIGASTASTVTGTTITGANFVGPLAGAVTGNVTGNTAGVHTGAVTGDVTGNITAASGTSSFTNVTINGSLDLNAGTSATVTGLSAPLLGTDATTKTYVDDADALKLNLAGGTLSGELAMGTSKITGLGTPTASADAATKGYVDQEVSDLVAAAPGALDTLNELAAAINDDASFSTTITTSIATKLPKAGGTMSGAIAMGTSKITGLGNPTLAQDASTKAYTDAGDALKVAKAGDTMSGALAMGTNKVTGLGTPTAGTDATTKTYVDAGDALKVTKSGDTMSGVLAMGANKITGVADPTLAQDVVTKNYSDTLFGSTTAAATSAANASTSEGNAATSETNAAASYDQFDDRFLGSKSADPTLDNDGDALLTGAMYWSTSASAMRLYDGSAWVSISPSAADQALINIVGGDLVYSEDLGSITEAVTTGSGNSISTVAAAITNIDTVATAVTNVNTVAGAITNVNLAAGSISNINTVASVISDVNRYAEEYTISTTQPSSPSVGDLWMDTTSNILKYYTGSAFSSIISGLLSVADDATPQLAASLDAQNNNILNVGTISGSNLQLDFGGLI